MKIKLLQINKTSVGWVKQGQDDYFLRLKNYIPFEIKDIEINIQRIKLKEQQLLEEAKRLLQFIKPGDYVVLLDDKGTQFTSEGFSVWMNKKFSTISNDLIFIIGGAYGFHEDIRKRANEYISLSTMTFTHQMVRIIFVEQVYRAMTILKNEPYHHS